ncbi:MAG: hypothetical protein KJ941_04000, partial [Bacteroidetes bacterium]|nr:hypothetical protein [Bacteroidota bacterium]
MTIRAFSFLLILSISQGFFAQQNLEPIDSYHKDQLWNKAPETSSFLPIPQSRFDLRNSLRDSSRQYYWITQKLFKEYLFEIKGDGYRIDITPVLNIARGKDRADSNLRSLFDNTRGVQI